MEGYLVGASTIQRKRGEDMNSEIPRTNDVDVAMTCFECGSNNVERAVRRQVFEYGEPVVQLFAEMPVYTCRSCDFQFAGPEAEEARHEAVCRHLGVFTPSEIIAIRERTGLSRAQFAEQTGIGIASLKRWESGAVIQNVANNNLIYLMSFRDNLDRLKQRIDQSSAGSANSSAKEESADNNISRPRRRRFRGRCTAPDERALQIASTFRLRAR